MDQCPFAVEDLMRELKVGSDDLSEDDDWSDEDDKLVAKGEHVAIMDRTLITHAWITVMCSVGSLRQKQ